MNNFKLLCGMTVISLGLLLFTLDYLKFKKLTIEIIGNNQRAILQLYEVKSK